MKRILLKSKIHRATVTVADLHYEGSVTIDRHLMDAADLVPYEQVDIYDISNGARLTTYAIAGEPGSGTIGINGAAARLVKPDDLIIIASYVQVDEDAISAHCPKVVLVDERNRLCQDTGRETVSR